MQSSAKTTIKKDYVRKDGRGGIILQIIIKREVKKIPLNIYWFPKLFKDGVCIPRFKDDRECADMNLVIGDSVAKANEIFIQYRLRRKELSMDAFITEYKWTVNKDDFIAYYEQKMKDRLRNGEICLATVMHQTVTINHLKAFKKRIAFAELNERFGYKFDAFLLRKTGSQTINARWGQHRNIKTYLNAAKRDRIEFENPYEYFKMSTREGRFQPLHKDELLKFYRHYKKETVPGNERNVLRAFLFCCLTGMRHSDIRRVKMDIVDGNFFEYLPYKTRKHETKVRIPATPEAMEMLVDEIDEVGKEPMFCSVSEQKDNTILKKIAEHLEIVTDVCFQVGRETFATLYMEHDGILEILAKFMGHTTTKMSEKYVKIRDQRKKAESVKISAFLKEQK